MVIDTEYFYFFSYGSNLLLERIRRRTSSAEIVQHYHLSGYRILFNKRSRDGSTKTNIEKTESPKDCVKGIIHRIHNTEKSILDGDEAGYHLEKIPVSLENGQHIELNYYIANADRITVGKPYDWYLEYVIMGAIENSFAKDYVQNLLAVEPDIDERPATRAGYNHELTEKVKAHKKRNPEVWKV